MAAGFKTATVNAADIPATQTNFPAYVDLSRLGITTQAEADSVRVYAESSKTTEWAREIVSASEMWVKIPSLTSTTAIYVDWDGVRANYANTDTYGRNAVWSGYNIVYHLNQTSGTTCTSSTGSFDGTYNGNLPDGVAGPIGTAQDLDGTGDYVATGYNGNGPGKTYSMIIDTNSSVQGWVLGARTGGAQNRRIDIRINSGLGGGASSGAIWLNMNDASSNTQRYYSGNIGINNGNNNLLHVTFNTTEILAYLNGSAVSLTTETDQTLSSFTFSVLPYLGAFNDNPTALSPYVGILDEFHVVDALSANWITIESNNQLDEAGFWGTWSNVGSGTTVKTYTGVTTASVKTVYNGTAIANRKTWNGIS